MNAKTKDYGPCLLAGVWLVSAIVKPGFYTIASAAVVSLLSLQLWLEWHREAFK